jgi:serine/threonine protein phosphatase PrpC
MPPEIDFAGREIRGGRENQEDFYAFEELESGGLLLALADGVGGEMNGELASQAAVHGFLDSFALSHEPVAPRFSSALKRANQSVARVIDALPGAEVRMATTLVALRVENGELHWISVGDSPLLLFREGQLIRLNADHSGKAERHEPGLARNALASALTGGLVRLIDQPDQPYPLKEGDLLLAASDGLWTLSLKDIADHLSDHLEEKTAQIAASLLALIESREKANQDNVTVALIKIMDHR